MLFNCLKVSVLAACVGLLPQMALARLNPSPPPSGVVVHLFGPDSVMDHLIPQSAVPAASGPAGQVSNTAGGSPAAVAQGPAYVEPSMGDVMHQMFVTGDPNDPPKPSTGRTVERP
jgi:hypothetical protein